MSYIVDPVEPGNFRVWDELYEYLENMVELFKYLDNIKN
jgi:hypothetical protein